MKKAWIALIVMLIITGVGYYLYNMYQNIEIKSNYDSKRLAVSTDSSQTVENINKNSKNIANMIEEVTQSVCGISKLKSVGGSILSKSTEDDLGLGTGIIVSSNGYILSNNHVTGDKYSTCYVTIDDGNTYNGKVVWADSDLDLSLTKIDAENLAYANLGNSSNVRAGETVYAIGNPVGLEFRRTVTSGIISALNRTVKITENNNDIYMSNLLQTDATINPGNSGGPLVYATGEVIGVNSVKITSAEGMGFAVPINVVKPVINRFINDGSFKEASLGISVYDKSISQYLSLNDNFASGVYVEKIMVNGASYNTDLKKGDIISSIDGNKCSTVNELREYIYTKNPGDKVTLNINRGKINRDIEVKLGEK